MLGTPADLLSLCMTSSGNAALLKRRQEQVSFALRREEAGIQVADVSSQPA